MSRLANGTYDSGRPSPRLLSPPSAAKEVEYNISFSFSFCARVLGTLALVAFGLVIIANRLAALSFAH